MHRARDAARHRDPDGQPSDADHQERDGHDIKAHQNPALQLVAALAQNRRENRGQPRVDRQEGGFGFIRMLPIRLLASASPSGRPRSKRFTGGGSGCLRSIASGRQQLKISLAC